MPPGGGRHSVEDVNKGDSWSITAWEIVTARLGDASTYRVRFVARKWPKER